jgi:hypothetical protein
MTSNLNISCSKAIFGYEVKGKEVYTSCDLTFSPVHSKGVYLKEGNSDVWERERIEKNWSE